MVTLDLVMGLLLELCPEFHLVYEEYLRAFYDPGEVPEPVPYADVSAFTMYRINALRSGHTENFASVFAFAERLFDEGDGPTKNWVGVGFLEGLQNQL